MKSRIHLLRYGSCPVLPHVPVLSPPGCLLGTGVALISNKAKLKYPDNATIITIFLAVFVNFFAATSLFNGLNVPCRVPDLVEVMVSAQVTFLSVCTEPEGWWRGRE